MVSHLYGQFFILNRKNEEKIGSCAGIMYGWDAHGTYMRIWSCAARESMIQITYQIAEVRARHEESLQLLKNGASIGAKSKGCTAHISESFFRLQLILRPE